MKEKENKKKSLKRFLLGRAKDVVLLYLATHYRPLLKFVSSKPSEVSIKVTQRCNSRCITCNEWKEKPENELTTKEIEDIFHQIKSLGVEIVGFTGGEPLLRNDIGELIEKAKKITGARVYIITNGILLPERAKTLMEKGIDYVSVSIDGLPETDTKIRGIPRHYDRAIEGIKILRSVSKDLKINVGTTVLKPNIKEIPQLVEICHNLKVNWFFNLLDTSLYFFQGVNIDGLLIDDEKTIDEFIDYLYLINKEKPDVFMSNMSPIVLEFARDYLKNKKPKLNCVIGYFRVFVDSNLNIYSGCWALPPIGNLKEEGLKEIIKSKKYKERVKKMFDLKCPTCTCGYILSCSLNNLPSTALFALKDPKFVRFEH
ncbi:radical SAM protein [Dehalococcoidia bacterium]|nr:radical SAM protein [Dehalococcoidia bacterium]MCL0063711.1 radical SAM protein [Dehalococcoidia bacterium]